jgi:WD40 repeat protein/serine/threonine protein kinase
MSDSRITIFCIVCGREFRPRDADTVICPDCGGPPEAPAPSQPQGTALADQPRGTVLMSQPAYQRMCILCGQDFTTPDPQADRCPQCRGEAPHPQPEIRSRPKSRQPTPAMPAPAQRTVAMPESGLSPAPSSADVPLTWNAGDVILDLYEVKGELGKGGMGVVYRVHHRQWNIDLAVKTPLPEALQKAGSLENFLREAQAWVDLGLHPHIVTCYYVRRLGEMPRVFAECMEGGSLKNWMEDGRLYAGGKREALQRILDCAIQFAWGLGYAHEKGLVHQDVKPANALMTPDGMLKVTDFGLVGAKGYTPAYAAPEQELGQAVSPRTDLWGWGVSVLEMFTGGVHWQFGSVAASVLENYLQEAPPEGIPPMPAALAELLRQCFQDDPEQRPASMDEVAERLMRLYEQEMGAPYPRPKPQALELRADSLNNKAVSLLDLGQEEEAVRCWQEALQADPAHLEANFNYGYYRWQKAELLGSEFLKQLQRLESTHGSDPEYWRLLGWVYLEQGYVEEVEEILEKRGMEDAILRYAHQNPKRTSCRLLKQFEICNSSITAVDVSPDSRLVVSGHEDGSVSVWDVFTGQSILRLNAHNAFVESVAFSFDGKYIASGCRDSKIYIWSIKDSKEICCLEGHRKSVLSVDFATSKHYLVSGGEDGSIILWDIFGEGEMKRLETNARIACVLFLPSGEEIVAAENRLWNEDYRLLIWNFLHAETKYIPTSHLQPITSITLSGESGKYIFSSSLDGKIQLSTTTQLNPITVTSGTMPVWAIASLSRGRNIVSADSAGIRLWDLGGVKGGREIRFIDINGVNCIKPSPDNRYVIAGREKELVMLELQNFPLTGVNNHPYPLLAHITNVAFACEMQKQSHMLLEQVRRLIDNNRFQQAYDLLRRIQSLPLYSRDPQILDLITKCANTNGKRINIRNVWQLYIQEVTTQVHDWDDLFYAEQKEHVKCIAFCPTASYFITGGMASTPFDRPKEYIHIWDMSVQRLRTCGIIGNIDFLEFSPDGQHIAIARGFPLTDISVWDVINDELVYKPEIGATRIEQIGFSPDGQFVFAVVRTKENEQSQVYIWEWRAQRMLCTSENISSVKCSVFSPDGNFILLGNEDGTIYKWEIANSPKCELVLTDIGSPKSLKLTPNGMYVIILTTNGEIRIVDNAFQRQQSCVLTKPINSIALSQDGNFMVGGGDDGFLYAWKVVSANEIFRSKAHLDPIRQVAFAPSGEFVLSVGRDSKICLSRLDWDYDFPDPADWDEGARPYLDIFLTLHTPYGPDGLSRVGKPQWTEEDFQKLLQELGYRGYGWLRPEGVRRELEKMAKERK